MKKIFWIAVAVLGLFTAASCQKEPVVGVSGGESDVTLTVELPEVLQTKAMSEADHADIVYFEIWNSDWSEQLYPADGEFASAKVVGRTAVIEAVLIANQTYKFIFWAQDKDHDAYDVSDLQNVKIDYSVIAADGNQDKYDAYYAVETIQTTGPINKTVTLYRPFAQLNFGTSNMQSIFGDINLKNSEITVEGLATSFNTLEGIGESEQPDGVSATFVAQGIATDQKLEVNGADYTWIAMDYMLMMGGKSNVDISASFDLGMKDAVVHSISNVPLQKNHRTNIIGDLFTADAHLDVVIDPAFDVPDHNIVVDTDAASVYNVEQLLTWLYTVNYVDNTASIKLEGDIVLPQYTIEVDHAKKAYRYTTTPIVVNNGIPSGSNWVPAGMFRENTDVFAGHVEGNGYTIRGMRIADTEGRMTGFIGNADGGETNAAAEPYNIYVNNLNFDDAVVYASSKDLAAGILAAHVRNIKGVDNCHVTNSSLISYNLSGGLVGQLYTRQSDQMVIMSNCSVDEKTVIQGHDNVGGLVGYNYGSLILNCTNAASVYGNKNVGGIAGTSRSYQSNRGAYVIGCGNSGDIIAAGKVGSIIGCNQTDSDHINADAGMVACYSTAARIDADKAILIGFVDGTETHIGSWGLKTPSLSEAIFNNEPSTACYAFGSASEITQAEVDAMNDAIAAYNALRAPEHPSYCPYTWSWTPGSLPVLN